MSQSVKYVGLDVHKDTIAVAVAEGGKRAEVREHGEIANKPAALAKLLGKLGGPGVELNVCYEAGPCGYVSIRRRPRRREFQAASAVAGLAQFQGSSSSSWFAGCSAMRARTSASQACGSTSLSLAVPIKPNMMAAR